MDVVGVGLPDVAVAVLPQASPRLVLLLVTALEELVRAHRPRDQEVDEVGRAVLVQAVAVDERDQVAGCVLNRCLRRQRDEAVRGVRQVPEP